MTGAHTHLFWVTSRAAGVSALVLASIAVAAGLALGMRGGPLQGRAAQLRTIHEALSLATLAALGLHALALLGDACNRPAMRGTLLGFASIVQTVPGLALLALFYPLLLALAALSLSYYFRARIGVARWRRLHRFIALFWLLGIVHTLGSGTDSGEPWFLALAAMVVLAPLALLCVRRFGSTVARRAMPASAS